MAGGQVAGKRGLESQGELKVQAFFCMEGSEAGLEQGLATEVEVERVLFPAEKAQADSIDRHALPDLQGRERRRRLHGQLAVGGTIAFKKPLILNDSGEH